ncbi:S1 family peptidase [Anabaena catenula]|uniref:Trypsin-like peptidase domain-containing protein n=1 Tax=Anabaena catenula FACHB-362 TaxID=2692877 RepID=A0ABR8J148_9NOST|nr:serine protease [Anabaena catenula]MBD2691372.1 trypsin-like peptidase domain-containing protein [Anabaena catenula FACHB-362]
MSFNDRLMMALMGSVVSITIIQPSTAYALTGEEVNDIAREVTVLIKSDKGHGSGVIVAKDSKTYYVLTAFHVVSNKDNYKIVTHDKKAYQLDYGKVKRLSGVDLAIVEFSSDQDYKIAKLANSETVKEGKPVFVSGWPRLTTVGQAAGGQLVRQFTGGRVSGFLPQSLEGYKMSYDNKTLGGMSGGPVLDAGGRVVGIHGLGDTEDPNRLQQSAGLDKQTATSIAGLIKPGFNYAIPINTFLSLAPQSGIYLGLQVENSAAGELGAPYADSTQPDKRDTIDNINDVLGTAGRALDTINGVRNFFR